MTETKAKPDAALVEANLELKKTNESLKLLADEAVKDRDEALQAKQSAQYEALGLSEANEQLHAAVESLRAQRDFYKQRWAVSHKLLVGHDVAKADVAKAEESFR